MPDKPKKTSTRKTSGIAKTTLLMIKKLRSDLKDATKKLTVHQDPKSKMSASLRSMMDQPRKKKVRSPHKDKKNEKRINPKYKDIFKRKKP